MPRVLVAGTALAGTLIAATAAAPALGQVMSPMVYNGFIGGSAVAAAGRRAREVNHLAPDGRPIGPRARAAAPAPTGYRRDPAVSRQVVANFTDYVQRVAGPQKATVVRSELDKRDFVQAWTTINAEDGFHPGDVADATAAYWALNWAMANERVPNARQLAGLRAQIHADMPYNPIFASFPEAKRQEMAETYMINYIYQQGVYVDAMKAGDKALQRKLSDAAEARFRNEMHVDLRSLALTDRGFVQRG